MPLLDIRESPAPTAPPRPIRMAKMAVAVTFGLNGFAFASWASRVPAVKDRLGLTASGVGALLLCLSVGAVVAMPLAGPIVHRVRPAGALTAGVAIVTTGALLIALGIQVTAVPVAAAGLAVSGVGMSIWDVAMNVHAADVERRLRRTLMPRFHAAFSLGTAGGALVAAGAAAAGLGVATQLTVTAPLVAACAAFAVRRFLPTDPRQVAEPRGRRVLLDAWHDSRTLLIGAVVFAFALLEGVANDWLALAVTDGLRVEQWLGSSAFAAFAIAMTVTRLSGGRFLERHGRTIVLRASAALAALGTLLVITAPSAATAVSGAALWGTGAALGFPVALSAAADDPASAAARVSVISTIGYTAFLAGPPLVGMLADTVGVRPALLVTLIAAGVALLTAPATSRR